MGIETIAAIAAPLVIGAISKAMSDSGEGDVRAAQAQKNAAMQKSAGEYAAYRPEINKAEMNAMRGQSTAYQGAGNVLASSGGGQAPAGLNYNPFGEMFPQNQIPPSAPGMSPSPRGPNPGQAPAPVQGVQKLTAPNPYVDMSPTPPAATTPKPMEDALKIRAALGNYQPGNVAPTLGPSPVGPGPGPDPFLTAMRTR